MIMSEADDSVNERKRIRDLVDDYRKNEENEINKSRRWGQGK